MHGHRLLSLGVDVVDVDDVGVQVVRQPGASRRVIPAKIQAADARPGIRDVERRHHDAGFRHREHRARSEHRLAVGAGFAFVVRVAGQDRVCLLTGVVLGIVDAHEHHDRAGVLVDQEPLDRRRHAFQRREGHVHRAQRRVGACDRLHVDVVRRLLIQPDEIERFRLELRTALLVVPEAQHALAGLHVAATTMAHHDDGHRARHSG
ncbi:hypothetical protein D3C87_1302200 [compost metagenome]